MQKKILILSSQMRTDNTGVRVYCDSLEKALADAGAVVARRCHHDCRPFVKRLSILLIKAVRPFGRDFQQVATQLFIFFGARDVLRAFDPVEWVVLAQDPITGAAASRRGFATLVTCHASDPVEENFRARRFGPLARKAMRRLLCGFMAQCRAYAALSSAQRDVLRRYCPSAAITVVPTICRVKPGLPLVAHTGFRLAMMGRLEPLKGQERLVEALPLVADKSCEVWFVGAGADESRLRDLAASLGVAGRVRFCGQSAQPDALLRECDLYVHTSRMEAMSLAPIEAVYAGIPAWCYETPGFNDFGLFDDMPALPQTTTAPALAAQIDRWIARGPSAARAAWSAQFAKAAAFAPARAAQRYLELVREIDT